MNTKYQPNHTETCETIKLGIDAHAKWFCVARQLDGATPQPVRYETMEAAFWRECLELLESQVAGG